MFQPRKCSFREQATKRVNQTDAAVVIAILLIPLFEQWHKQDGIQALWVPSYYKVVKQSCNCLVQLQILCPPKLLCSIQSNARSLVAAHTIKRSLDFLGCEWGMCPLADMGSYLWRHKVWITPPKHRLEVRQEGLM